MTTYLFFYDLMLRIGLVGLIAIGGSFGMLCSAFFLAGDALAERVSKFGGLMLVVGVLLCIVGTGIGLIGIVLTAIHLAVA